MDLSQSSVAEVSVEFGLNIILEHTVEAEQDHLGLRCPEDQVTELLHLHASLERKLQLATLDDDVGEIEQMDLKRVKHTLSSDDDLLRLLFDGERTNESCYFLSRLPLCELTETLLPCPDTGVNDLQEQLTRARVEDEDSSIDGLGSQVTLEGLVDGDTVDVGVVDEPNDLVGEELGVVLGVEVGFGGFGGVELQTLADTLTQDVASGVGLHDLGHGLLNERLQSGEPVTVSRPQVVSEVHADHDTSGRGVDTHGVGDVVEELGASISLDVVGVKVSPTELDVDPELVASCTIENVLDIGDERGARDVPLVR